jgi:hypothetical protein
MTLTQEKDFERSNTAKQKTAIGRNPEPVPSAYYPPKLPLSDPP